MPITFAQLVERMRTEADLLGSGDESRSMEAIRSGLNFRKENCGDFWEDFMNICGNAEALSELLDVPKEKITGWPSKIRDILQKVKDADSQEDSGKEMLNTGEEEI